MTADMPGLLDDVGVFRDITTGVNPAWAFPEDADGALDAAGDPGEPIVTRFEGPWGAPWWDGMEDPTMPIGLPFTESPNPTHPNPSLGAQELPGAYEGAYRTHGSVYRWGHEPSGGFTGDQAIGRIQRFPSNIPDRYDPNGIWNVDYRDELAAVLAANDTPALTDTEVTTNLVMWPNVSQY